MQYNEKQIEFLILPYHSDKSPSCVCGIKDDDKHKAVQDGALEIFFFLASDKSSPSFPQREFTFPRVFLYLCVVVEDSFCSRLQTMEKEWFVLLCVVFDSTVSHSYAADLSCASREFQFGHMDGNDYINSLIMG